MPEPSSNQSKSERDIEFRRPEPASESLITSLMPATSSVAVVETEQQRSYLGTAFASLYDKAMGTPDSKEQFDRRDTFSQYASNFVKTACLFIPGKPVRAFGSAAIAYALDEAKPSDSATTQVLDAALGAAKGTAIKGSFSIFGGIDSVAVKGVLMGSSARLVDTAFSRKNYFDSNGSLSLQAGYERIRENVVNRDAVAADMVIFGLSHGILGAANRASGEALLKSPFAATLLTGSTFGLVSGANAEIAAQRNNGSGSIDWVKVAQRGLLQSGIDTVAALPGAYMGARMQRQNLAQARESLPREQRAIAGRMLETQPYDPLSIRLSEVTQRLGQPAVETTQLVVARPEPPGGYRGAEDFAQRGGERVETPVRVYPVEGHKTVIVVPEEYARGLDRVRAVRLRAERGDSAVSGQVPDITLLNRALPEDFIPLLDRLPDSSIVKRVVLRNDVNPADYLHRLESGNPTFVSDATATPRGDMTFYRYNLTPNLAVDGKHEWSHIVKYNRGLEGRLFELAEQLEKFGYHSRGRALVNSDENFAVHLGEDVLGHNPAKIKQLVEEAPIRTLIMGRALARTLELVPGERRSVPGYEHAQQRLQMLEQQNYQQRGIEQLNRIATGNEPAAAETAAKLMVSLGEGRNATGGPSSLSFARSSIFGDYHFSQMRTWDWLQSLDVSRTNVGRQRYFHDIAEIPKVDTLSLASTMVENSSLAPVSRMQTLRSLDLSGTRIDDGSIVHLSRMPQLLILDLTGTKVSSTGLQRLQQALPTTEIVH